jgi:hypothetical protein
MLPMLSATCRSFLLATALAAAPASAIAAACSEGPAGGIGGTSSPAHGGIGGTGAPAELALGGIGGTGQPALPIAAGETGAVIGTITGFASICVNGLEVHYQDSTPVTANGTQASISTLAIGQVVAIEATTSQRGLEARQVAIVHAVVGPVSRVDGEQFEVMGQRVLRATTTTGPAPKLGETVRVSGLRDADGVVIATRVESADSAEVEHSVVGRVRNGRIDGLEIEAAELPEDAEVVVRGRFEQGRLRARQVERNPARVFADRARAISIEARVSERSGRRVSAGGQRIELGDDTRVLGGRRDDAERNRLIRASGRVDKDGNLRAERLEIRDGREDRPRRDDAGDRGSDDRRGGGDRDDRSAHSGRDRPERAQRSDSGTDDRPDRIERAERAERAERIERPEHD